MRGRHVVEISSIYKRAASKDPINAYGKQENSGVVASALSRF